MIGHCPRTSSVRAVEHAEREGDLCRKIGVDGLGAMLAGKALSLLVKGIRNLDQHVDAPRDRHDIRRGDTGLRRLRVGAHEPSRAKQDSAEIPCDNHGDVGQARMLDSLERRHARRFLGLAVVGVAHATVLTQHVGVHVVARHAVLAADLVEERERLFLGFDMLDGGNEATLLLDDLGARTTLSCAIRGHAAPFVFGKTQLCPIIAHARKQAGAGRGRC